MRWRFEIAVTNIILFPTQHNHFSSYPGITATEIKLDLCMEYPYFGFKSKMVSRRRGRRRRGVHI